MKRVCIHCKKQYGCYVGVVAKDCGKCDYQCSISDDITSGLCELCFPIVLEYNKRKRVANAEGANP